MPTQLREVAVKRSDSGLPARGMQRSARFGRLALLCAAVAATVLATATPREARAAAISPRVVAAARGTSQRSEERRVGKECRSRRVAMLCKRNTWDSD